MNAQYSCRALFIAVACASKAASAQPSPTLLKDIETAPVQAVAEAACGSGPLMLLTIVDRHGGEPWWLDDSAPSPTLIADLDQPINSGPWGPRCAGMLGGRHLLTASEGLYSWRGPGFTPERLHRKGRLLNVGPDRAYIAEGEPDSILVWESDGTASGTFPMAQLPGPISFDTHVGRLPNGAVIVARYAPPSILRIDSGAPVTIATFSTSVTGGIGVLGAAAMFFVRVGAAPELWSTDGSTVARVSGLCAGLSGAGFGPKVGPRLLIQGDCSDPANRLWATDGTPEGTVPLGAPAAQKFAAFGDKVVLMSDNHLWVTDGTPAGTHALAPSIYFRGFTVMGDRVVALSGLDMWVTDGTSEGTRLAFTIPDPNADSQVDFLAATPSKLVYRLSSFSRPYRLLRSDGTSLGEEISLPTYTASSSPSALAPLGGGLFFLERPRFDSGAEPWRSDGTSFGTRRIDNGPGPNLLPRDPTFPVPDGRVFFMDTGFSSWMWRTDGTRSGTQAILPVDACQSPMAFESGVLFGSRDVGGNCFIMVSNGTVGGTRPFVQSPTDVYGYHGSVLASAEPGGLFLTSGRQLWKASTGGALDTLHVFSGSGEALIGSGVSHGNRLFFSFATPLMPFTPPPYSSIWTSDGTASGTLKLAEGFISPLSAPGGRMVGFASDGFWGSNATPSGTGPLGLAAGRSLLDHKASPELAFLLLQAPGTQASRELWRSDGTSVGTYRLHPQVGSPSEILDLVRIVDGTLWFNACDLESGCEPWKTDGTGVGTRKAFDLAPGPESGYLLDVAQTQSTLFLSANASSAGAELWSISRGGLFHPLAPCRVFDSDRDGAPGAIAVTGRCGIPPTARQVAANVTGASAPDPTEVSEDDAFAEARLTILTVPFGRARAVNRTMTLRNDGSLRLSVWPVTSRLVLDVSGYFE